MVEAVGIAVLPSIPWFRRPCLEITPLAAVFQVYRRSSTPGLGFGGR